MPPRGRRGVARPGDSAETLPQNRRPGRRGSHDSFAERVRVACEPSGLLAVTPARVGAQELLERRGPFIKLPAPRSLRSLALPFFFF